MADDAIVNHPKLKRLGGLGNIVTQQILDETYYETYGLNTGVDTNNPLNLVLVRPAEDVNSYDPLLAMIKRFATHAEFFNKLGVGLLEFLHLPPYVVEELFEISTAKAVQTNQTMEEMERLARAAGK